MVITQRPFAGEADLPAVTALLNLCSDADQLDDTYDVADLRLEFADPEFDPERNLRLWEDDHGALIAFGQVWIDERDDNIEASLYWRVHPDGRDSSLADEVFAWAGERLREAGKGSDKPLVFSSSAREHFAFARATHQRHDMTIVRYFYQMKRSLAEPIPASNLPDGFTLRHVANDADIRGWVDAFNQSFIDHYNYHPRTEEQHRHWLQHPSYDPARDLIAVAPDGMIAAFCFCMIDPAENARNNRNDGWIAILGTRRGFRKQGLGRAMLLHGLRALQQGGADTARLNLDAENPNGAFHLYESAGFSLVHTWVRYTKTL